MAKLVVEIVGTIKKYIVSYKVGSEIGLADGALIKKEFKTLEDAEEFLEIVQNKGSVIFAHLM
ncbi:hypothetical protein PY093_20315 [Cytobacillus sp. S13-E01]|uniref:hypothetical protein n=1 Tax=Cytobacillus sp. S13-E01 TaxID=3031326 RepID=UPI0023D8409C|nr:hypothetical protein [Cytobacillus sp. S13-E01]MDF0728961.1 hypothetical protein [Cytobacillus sp. S13-E01]